MTKCGCEQKNGRYFMCKEHQDKYDKLVRGMWQG